MGEIFEQVWLFFMDTLEFDPPVSDPLENNDLYNIYVENLPSYYFGITILATITNYLNSVQALLK